jgi:polysaccharide biosynthesis transport protein
MKEESMRQLEPRDVGIAAIIATLWRCRWRCVFTMLVVLGVAIAYAVFVPPTWLASQAIIVRDDATARFSALGRLREDEEVKNTQETLLEIATSSSMLRNALRSAGPTDADNAATWPTEEAVADLRNAVSLAPPKGTEFGKTAVFYLKVKNRNRERALQLTDAIYTELGEAFGQLRATMAQSAISELKESVTLTEANLAQATNRLAEVEKVAGIDLVALRMLHQSPVGDVPIYHTLAGGLEELRQTTATQAQQATLLAMLKKAQANPLLLLAAPKELLDCHPGLARLIQGLSEAQLRSYTSASKLSEQHPEMLAVRREEANIREGIRKELATAIQGVSAARDLVATRRATLESQLNELNQRLGRLTNIRAEYSNLVAQVEQRRGLLEESQRNLAQARAACAAATTSSLLSRVDAPDGGLRPISPSRAIIGLAGLLGSVLAGVGIVLLTAPIAPREPMTVPFAPREAGSPRAAARRANSDRVILTRVAEPAIAGDRDI